MNKQKICRFSSNLILLGALASPEILNAQFFSYSGTGDVLAGFRKTGVYQGNYELIVNLGNVTNLVAMAQGTTVGVSQFSPAQLTAAFPDGFQDLQWSVFSSFSGTTPWTTPLGSFPQATIWYTLPRTSADIPTQAKDRFVDGTQGALRNAMFNIGLNAAIISTGLGSTNSNNNELLVREPVSGNSSSDLTAFIGDVNDPTLGDFGGQYITFAVENTTPSPFDTAVRSDFYQSCPASVRRGPVYPDPITGQTNGAAYLVGYFLLNPDGTMSFTRSSTNAPVPPPAPRIVSISSSAGSSTISFTTTNGATYQLFYTNSAGLSSPVSTWPSLSTTLVGDGTTRSLTDTTASDAARFYRVGAH